MKKRVIELFAGVGGFRVGLNDVKLKKNGKANEKKIFDFVWANQWEPSTKEQDAFNCYKERFCYSVKNEKEFSNVNIENVDKSDIPDFELLTGGFPCQDYSVARSLINEKGIEGHKGVLWWQIDEILSIKNPPFVLLENVDRLLKSPSKQRGRDFGIMLKCFADKGYMVEWRVINASEYGMPQKRHRIYIFAYSNKTRHYEKMINLQMQDILLKKGIFALQFPVKNISDIKFENLNSYESIEDISQNFNFRFEKSGYMVNGKIITSNCVSYEEKKSLLNDIIEKEEVDKKYFLDENQIKKFIYLKGSKKLVRVAKNGHKYMYSEGAMSFPDNLYDCGRTMLTSEGTVNRSSHVVIDKMTKKMRFLTSIECERLNQFPDNWTNTMNDKRRHFVMGNALVTGVIKRLGIEISKYIKEE